MPAASTGSIPSERFRYRHLARRPAAHFETLYRADPARNREEVVSGLGLSVARWIVEAPRNDSRREHRGRWLGHFASSCRVRLKVRWLRKRRSPKTQYRSGPTSQHATNLTYSTPLAGLLPESVHSDDKGFPALIIFRADIEGLSAPHSSGAHPTEATDWDAVRWQLRAMSPGARIGKITFPKSATDFSLIQAESGDKQELEIFAEPGSGAFLGSKNKVAWLDPSVDFHQDLLSGNRSGALHRPHWHRLVELEPERPDRLAGGPAGLEARAGVPKSGPWRRVNYELHKWGGLWANALLLVISATGIILAYPDAFRSAAKSVSKPRVGR